MTSSPDSLAGEIAAPPIPDYLQRVYWWAYLHPRAVFLFEREWLVNLILWGNYQRLCDEALSELGGGEEGQRLLQVACVYGDLTQRVAGQMGARNRLDVIDVAPIQLSNLRRKLQPDTRIHLHQQDSRSLRFADGTFDRTLLFFLLHEQPEEVRRATLAEALRVTRPGGKVVIVDYHGPESGHPLRQVMKLILRTLEPFALDLWKDEIRDYLPKEAAIASYDKATSFRGLYQKIVIQMGDRGTSP
jgi:ubiquinone/menaquinone biosynthesis C-methylase UbiE